MNKSYIALGAILFGLSTTAAAQSYVSFGAGVVSLDETEFQVAPGTISTDFDGGSIISAAYGYQFSGFRAEIQALRLDNDVDTHALGGGAPLDGPTGEATTTALMGNIFYDFFNDSGFTPYVGAGIGYADVDFSGFGVAAIPDVLDDGDTVLAYQLIAGGDYAFSPTTSIFGQYSYFSTDDVEVQTSAATGAVNTELSNEGSTFQIGVRIRF